MRQPLSLNYFVVRSVDATAVDPLWLGSIKASKEAQSILGIVLHARKEDPMTHQFTMFWRRNHTDKEQLRSFQSAKGCERSSSAHFSTKQVAPPSPSRSSLVLKALVPGATLKDHHYVLWHCCHPCCSIGLPLVKLHNTCAKARENARQLWDCWPALRGPCSMSKAGSLKLRSIVSKLANRS